MDRQRAGIAFEKNGPMEVEHLRSLTDSAGRPFPVREKMRLCRCGNSSTKPFCDASHKRAGWTDENEDGRQPDVLDRYEGDGVTILDNRRVCAHAGSCVARLSRVFGGGTDSWIDPKAATADEIIDTIRHCPSGALSYEVDGTPRPPFDEDEEIIVTANGPYFVRGGIPLDGVALGEGQAQERYALCRCGRSRNKPFCDGGHQPAGFSDPGRAPEDASEDR